MVQLVSGILRHNNWSGAPSHPRNYWIERGGGDPIVLKAGLGASIEGMNHWRVCTLQRFIASTADWCTTHAMNP